MKNYFWKFFIYICIMLCFSACTGDHVIEKHAENSDDSSVSGSVKEKILEETTPSFILPVSSANIVVYDKHPLGVGSSNGIFLSSPEEADSPSIAGTDILATANGTVIEICTNYVPGSGYGKYLVLEHDDEYQSLYGHCWEISVSVGDQVRQGDKIAELGTTGATDRPGCYFEICKNSTPISLSQYFNNEKDN